MDALTEVSRLVDLFDPYEGDLYDVPAPGQVHHAWQYVEMLLEELPEMGYRHGPGVLLTYEETDFLWADRRLKPYLVIRMDNGDLVCYVRYLEESEYMIESLENKAEELKKKIEYVRSPYNDMLHYVIIADNTKIFTDFLNGHVFYTPGPAQDMPAVEP